MNYEIYNQCSCGRDQGDSCPRCEKCGMYHCGRSGCTNFERPPLVKTTEGLICCNCLNKDNVILIRAKSDRSCLICESVFRCESDSTPCIKIDGRYVCTACIGVVIHQHLKNSEIYNQCSCDRDQGDSCSKCGMYRCGRSGCTNFERPPLAKTNKGLICCNCLNKDNAILIRAKTNKFCSICKSVQDFVICIKCAAINMYACSVL